MELNLISDLTEDKINKKTDINTMDYITIVFGTYTYKITLIGFKCLYGKTSFYSILKVVHFFMVVWKTCFF